MPSELAQWAGLAGEVMIVGVRDHLEIWAVDKWQEYLSRCDPQYDQLAELALVAPLAQQAPPATKAHSQEPSEGIPIQPR